MDAVNLNFSPRFVRDGESAAVAVFLETPEGGPGWPVLVPSTGGIGFGEDGPVELVVGEVLFVGDSKLQKVSRKNESNVRLLLSQRRFLSVWLRWGISRQQVRIKDCA